MKKIMLRIGSLNYLKINRGLLINKSFILNTDLDVWGAYSYNDKKDVFRATIKTQKTDAIIENLSIQFSKINENTTNMKVAWDDTMADLEISY